MADPLRPEPVVGAKVAPCSPDEPAVRFTRMSRKSARSDAGLEAATFIAPAEPAGGSEELKGRRARVQGFRKGLVRVVNRPARFPPIWPFELRADMAAALLDFPTTRALCQAIADGDAPRPTALRGRGERREPVWSTDAVRLFVARRNGFETDELV